MLNPFNCSIIIKLITLSADFDEADEHRRPDIWIDGLHGVGLELGDFQTTPAYKSYTDM